MMCLSLKKNIKNLSAQGFFQIELTNLYSDDKAVEKLKTADGEKTKAQINEQIQALFKTKAEEKLTPEQKEIKQLKEQMAELLKSKNEPTETPAQKAKREAQEAKEKTEAKLANALPAEEPKA